MTATGRIANGNDTFTDANLKLYSGPVGSGVTYNVTIGAIPTTFALWERVRPPRWPFRRRQQPVVGDTVQPAAGCTERKVIVKFTARTTARRLRLQLRELVHGPSSDNTITTTTCAGICARIPTGGTNDANRATYQSNSALPPARTGVRTRRSRTRPRRSRSAAPTRRRRRPSATRSWSGPTHGTLSGTGPNRTYTPDGQLQRLRQLHFQGQRRHGRISNVATFNLTVTAVNDAPTCTNGSATTNEDTAKAITLSCADVERRRPSATSIVSGPTHGTLSGTGANRTYTPDANYNGSDSFTFKANDGTADSNVATFNLTVTAVNDRPPARDGAADSTNEDTAKAVTLAGLRRWGRAYQVTTLRLTDLYRPDATGIDRLERAPNSRVRATALSPTTRTEFNGSDSFKFEANDGSVGQQRRDLRLTVTPSTTRRAAPTGARRRMRIRPRRITLSCATSTAIAHLFDRLRPDARHN